ncbi:hypothetical protein B296_00025561 [Ensete ventricosum]|uniref:Uncharacterized protein n=1 Tax=Ensete ventricosum TaxID=4639 RepID=A0A427AT43_ENSVE|nr:hypothetical protein B296_00025561 [Ensete ventricosum]
MSAVAVPLDRRIGIFATQKEEMKIRKGERESNRKPEKSRRVGTNGSVDGAHLTERALRGRRYYCHVATGLCRPSTASRK